MNKGVAGVLLGCWMFSIGAVCLGQDAKFVASAYSDRYHLPTCKVAKKIRPADLIVFKTPEEAIEKGLVPCKKCYPPTSSKKSG